MSSDSSHTKDDKDKDKDKDKKSTSSFLKALEDQDKKNKDGVTMEGAGKMVADSLTKVRNMVEDKIMQASAGSQSQAKTTAAEALTSTTASSADISTNTGNEWSVKDIRKDLSNGP